MLLWQGYPNIGVDDRNQFDLIKSMPGGITGLKQMVKSFHASGVKVYWPYFRWDTGTRNEGIPAYEALTTLVVELDSDGVNGDTCDGELNHTWFDAAVAAGRGIVLEPQSLGGGRNLESGGWTKMVVDVASWGEVSLSALRPFFSLSPCIASAHDRASQGLCTGFV